MANGESSHFLWGPGALRRGPGFRRGDKRVGERGGCLVLLITGDELLRAARRAALSDSGRAQPNRINVKYDSKTSKGPRVNNPGLKSYLSPGGRGWVSCSLEAG